MNRPKFPPYDKKIDGFYFATHTKQGRQVTIAAYIDIKKTNYTCKVSIEDLIRHADELVREVVLLTKGFYLICFFVVPIYK